MNNDKTKSIFAIIVIITVLSGIFLYRGISQYRRTMNDKMVETIEKTNILIDEVIKNSNILYDVRLDALTNNEKIVSAFNARDRDALYEITLPVHKSLKTENHHYSNMHFHMPSGHSFLRMHKPEEFGDDLRTIRPIIMQVHKLRKSVHGYEIGKHGLFYRVAKPVFFNGTYIGALEFGIKVEEVAENIERILHVDVARFIDNTILNDEFRKNCTNEITKQGISLNTYGNNVLFSQLIENYNFNDVNSQESDVNGIQNILFRSGNLTNYLGETIAQLLIVQDISDEMASYRSFVIKSVFITLILVTAAYIILHFSFGSYIDRIIELNKTLETKVKIRTKDLEEVTEQLKFTNIELSQIFNTAADGMRVIDKNYNVLRVNSTFAKLIGREKKVLKNSLCHEYFRGEFCFTPECTLKRILNGENHIEMDVEKETDSGEKLSFLLTATPFTSSDGEILGVVENFKNVTNQKKVFNELKENEQYLNAIMSTVLAGVVITDEKSPLIIDANPYARKLIGLSDKDLNNTSIRDHLSLEKPLIDSVVSSGNTFEKEDFILTTTSGKKLNIRLSVARVNIKGKTYLVQSFSDITDVKTLVKKQLVDIHKAKSIMNLINHTVPRYTKLPSGCRLFTDSISIPCHAEGGDHLFVQHYSEYTNPKTVISLKDQSGHEVNCILRSIYTDLLHNAVLFNNRRVALDEIVTLLNNKLCLSHYFDQDEFFTSINVEIDHHSLLLKYISAGHPPFILIRDRKVRMIPNPDQEHAVSHLPIPFLKDATYASDEFQLRENDQLIFYTDGLTEMTIKNLNTAITSGELQDITQIIIDDIWSERKESIPVSLLMEKVLNHISSFCGENVTPGYDGLEPVNSSADDVTLIGLEIEPRSCIITKTICPENSVDITNFIRDIRNTVFNLIENDQYVHLESRIQMVLEEAVVNAWKHGNGMNPEKKITVRFSTRNDFVFEIIDQGRGFDFSNLPDPTLEVNIEKTSGRGLFIIRHFSDHIEWKGNGNHVVIGMRKINTIDKRKAILEQNTHIRLWEMNDINVK